jgi:hypothetical protein
MEVRQAAEVHDPSALTELDAAYLGIRDGLGYCKTPREYGAFPWEPYSHTPADGGARQPGMTGQVKEEILTRLGEFGLVWTQGAMEVRRHHLLAGEFLESDRLWTVPGVGESTTVEVPAGAVACTICQVPFLRRRSAGESGACRVSVTLRSGEVEVHEGLVPSSLAQEIWGRTGQVIRVDIA